MLCSRPGQAVVHEVVGTTATATATVPLPQDKFAKFIGMTGAQIVKEVLIERGVTQVFGYPGKARPVCIVWPPLICRYPHPPIPGPSHEEIVILADSDPTALRQMEIDLCLSSVAHRRLLNLHTTFPTAAALPLLYTCPMVWAGTRANRAVCSMRRSVTGATGIARVKK
jgi:hypothetical protein